MNKIERKTYVTHITNFITKTLPKKKKKIKKLINNIIDMAQTT